MRLPFIVILICHTTLYSQQPIILWDLHGVLLERKQNPFIAAITSPALSGMLKELNWSLIKNLISVSYNSYFSGGLNSQDFLDVAATNNAPSTQMFILSIGNAQDPMPGMQAIVQELSNLGYRQQIASNIGKRSFETITNPKLYPALAPIFNALDLDTAHIAQRYNGQLIKKPNPLFFQNYLALNRIDITTQPIILIDDTEANTIAAQKLGFDTIYFKNANQLRDELIKRTILVTPPVHHITNQQNYTRLYDPSHFYRKQD